MIITIVILTILLGISSWLAYVNHRKHIKAVEYAENGFYVYNMFMTSLYTRVRETLNTMNLIDHKGSFKSDDEVGATFDSLKECVTELDQFINKYVQAEKEKN